MCGSSQHDTAACCRQSAVIPKILEHGPHDGRLIPPDVMQKGIDGAPRAYEILKEKGSANGFARIDNSPGLGEPRRVIEDDTGILPATLSEPADAGRDGGGRGAPRGRDVRPDQRTSDDQEHPGITAPASDRVRPGAEDLPSGNRWRWCRRARAGALRRFCRGRMAPCKGLTARPRPLLDGASLKPNGT